jgi:hypothetical protein
MGGKPLEDDEAQEEDYEFREIAHFYGRDDLKGIINILPSYLM